MSSNSINVLLLFSSSDIGGAERSLSRMAFINSNPSISYQLSTFGSPGPLSKWIESKSIKCYSFNYKTFLLVKHIILHKPDVIYIIGFRLSIFLRFFCKIFTKNLLVQGVRWNPNSTSKLDKTFRIFEYFFSCLLDGYIVNSNAAGKIITSISKKNTKVIYNGVPFLPIEEIVLPKKKYVITLANLSSRKGHKDYIKVIAKIVKKIPSSQFIFLGNDNLNGQIQELIEKEGLASNVNYLGFHENVKPFLNQSKIFVLPSLYGEGCPTSILEAFSLSLPVIAYRIDGIPELVSHNIDGILLDVGGDYKLEDAIENLLMDPVKAIDMGKKGYVKVKENFLLDDMLNKHNAFFQELN